MGLVETMRDLFGSPYDGAVVTRAELEPMDTRAATGSIVWAPHQTNKPIWSTQTPARYVDEGWRKAPVVFACVMALADAVATARIAVVSIDGNDEPEPAEDTDLQRLLNRPNPMLDQAEFFQLVQIIASVSGYCVVEKERDRLGNVINLWPLRSDWLAPIPRTDSAPAWEYRIPGHRTPYILEPKDVAVYTDAPDPNLGYTGTAPMGVAFRELGIENAMTDFLKTFFDRGALPVYGVVPRQAFRTQEEADAFRERMMGKYGGALRSAEPMLLTGIEDVKRLGFDFDELAYPELRALSETQICTAFRVPPILVGVQAGLDKATYSNYEQARRNFYEDVIASKWRRIDGVLTRSLVPEFDETGALQIEFDTSEVAALQDDEDAKWERATAGLSAGGLMVDDFRQMVGLPPLANGAGQVLYQPFSATVVPVQVEGQTQRSRVMAELEPGQLARALASFQDDLDAKALGAGPFEQRDGRTYLNFDALHDIELRRHQRAAQHNREHIGRAADLLAPRLVTFFAEQGERLRAAIFGERGADQPIETRALEDVPWDAERAELATVVEQWFGEVGAALVADIAAQLDSGAVWSGGHPYIKQLYDQLGTRITGITETTRQQVERLIVDGLAEGKGLAELADEMDGMFTETYQNRAMTIARTESQWGINVATSAAYEQSGVTRAVLYDNPSHSENYGASDGLSCAERNGLVVPVTEVPRHAAGEHPNGTLAVGPVVEG